MLIEELPVNRQLRFDCAGQVIHLLRAKGERTDEVYLKVLAFQLYADREGLAHHPEWHGKFAPTWACVDLTGRVNFWLGTQAMSWHDLAHVLRHHAEAEVALVRSWPGPWNDEGLDAGIDNDVAQIRRHIHYRYTAGRLSITYVQPLSEWFDPGTLKLPAFAHRTIRF